MIIKLQELIRDNVDSTKYMVVWVVTFRKYSVAKIGNVIEDYLCYYNFKHALKVMHV